MHVIIKYIFVQLILDYLDVLIKLNFISKCYYSNVVIVSKLNNMFNI